MRRPTSDYKDEIPLGHGVFLIKNRGSGAELIPEMMSFQVDGRLCDVEDLPADFFDEELLEVINRIKLFLRAKDEGTYQ
ncbi:hypothetical protein GF359_10305 [candidate division WOR-3 bacterium]|uniref:Uncharacterized protein n=1 Tax=candidate division WOR-3 bacterium TaxID=2052148 RepID=A0A9D5QE00_UNCW3|nr:hypothetical protein [candidate division WOR-3 bacterium]MBD3365592.1 hypothetical protein [candidate division WOR-3 bacterium]